jgi:2-oxo-3-hexenedioate decarboxylase
VGRGERLVGVKLGLTSRAKQQRMGISSPLVAWLTDAMVLPADAPVPRDRLIHPRAEPGRGLGRAPSRPAGTRAG